MTAHWTQQLARSLATPDRTTAVPESHLDELLLWLSNPENPRVADLDRAITRAGLKRPEASARAYARIDQLLFREDKGSPARTLGLADGADAALVKQRYRRLIQVYHPDRHADRTSWATQRTERINRAFGAHRRIAATQTTNRSPSGLEGDADDPGHARWRRPLDRLVEATNTAGQITRWLAEMTPARRRLTLALLVICGVAIAISVSIGERPSRAHPVVRTPGAPTILSLPSLGRPTPPARRVEPSASAAVAQPNQASEEPTAANEAAATKETGNTRQVEQSPPALVTNLDVERAETKPVSPPPATTAIQPVAAPAAPLTAPPATPTPTGDGSGADTATSPAIESALAEPPPPAPLIQPEPVQTPPGVVIPAPALGIPPASPPARPVAPNPPSPPTQLAQGPVATPVTPTLGGTSIDCRPIAEQLARFQQAYETGALDQLMALYSPLARENALATWFAIRQTYADWFAKTSRRRIAFDQLHVKTTPNGERCAAIAAFRVDYLDSQSSSATKQGVIQLLFERRGANLLILRARY